MQAIVSSLKINDKSFYVGTKQLDSATEFAFQIEQKYSVGNSLIQMPAKSRHCNHQNEV